MNGNGKRNTASVQRPAGSMAAIAVIGLLGLTACASTDDRPDAELAIAQSSIEQAQRAGANEHAAQPLSAARDKLAAAQAAVARDEMLVAERLAKEAALDAKLADAMTRTRKAELAVEELNETIEVLREEIARGQASRGEMQ